MNKFCKRCGLEKSLGEFYAHPNMADGHVNHCKQCDKIRIATESRTPHGKAREKRRNQKRAVKGYFHKLTIKMRAKYPEKYKARSAVGRAVRSGKIQKQSCSSCGNNNLKEIEGHHPDYAKPLDVTWLCKRGTKNNCHLKLHFNQTPNV